MPTLVAVSGCSGPSAFSRIANARSKSGRLRIAASRPCLYSQADQQVSDLSRCPVGMLATDQRQRERIQPPRAWPGRRIVEAVGRINRRHAPRRARAAPLPAPRPPPRRRDLTHQPVQADAVGRHRGLALIRDRLAVEERESSAAPPPPRRGRRLPTPKRAARRIFPAPPQTKTAESAPAPAARHGQSTARRPDGVSPPRRSRAQRFSQPSARRDIRPGHGAHLKQYARAQPQSACGTHQGKYRAARNRPPPAHGRAATRPALATKPWPPRAPPRGRCGR